MIELKLIQQPVTPPPTLVSIVMSMGEAEELKESFIHYRNVGDSNEVQTRLGEFRYKFWCKLNDLGI